MGSSGSKSTYGIDPESCKSTMEGIRDKNGSDILIMSIKDQNVPGKLCIAGKVEQQMVEAITSLLKSDESNKDVILTSDEYDKMWDYTWRNTRLTSGHSTFSLAKSYFPKGMLIVKLLNTIADSGWTLSACPNFGGVESRDGNGNVTSCVDWPVFVFYQERDSPFTREHLMFAVKDSNIPGKLCAAGPVGELEQAMTSALKGFKPEVKCEKDSYDNDYDVVWRNTSITSGASVASFAKKYFPKGKTFVGLIECAYQLGWRAVGAPNFGGQGDSWPCIVFRKLKDVPSKAPEMLFCSLKDSNQPGKLCVSGRSADKVTDAVCGALTKVVDNANVKSEKDSYDNDHDAVARNVNITTGMAAFSLKLPYFPRCDSMVAFLDAVAGEGFQLAACPNFGGMTDSWPSFLFEKAEEGAREKLFLAVKDNNIPGKVCLGGGGLANDESLGPELLDVLRALCGNSVEQTLDDYDRTFNLAFKNTIITTGHATFTFMKPYWPHGFVVESILQVLFKHGWKAQGGPNFGDGGGSWPCIIFEKMA